MKDPKHLNGKSTTETGLDTTGGKGKGTGAVASPR